MQNKHEKYLVKYECIMYGIFNNVIKIWFK